MNARTKLILSGTRLVHVFTWDESEHPRGQPDNPGKFSKTPGGKGGGGQSKSASAKPSVHAAATPLDPPSDKEWTDWSESPWLVKGALSGKIDKDEMIEFWGDEVTPERLAEYKKTGERIQRAAETGIVREPILYRGEAAMSEEDLDKRYPIDANISLRSLTSTTTDQKIAESYADDGQGVGLMTPVVVKIHSEHRAFNGVKNGAAGADYLKEVILPKGAKFRVTNVSKSEDGKYFVVDLYTTKKPK